MLHDVRRGASRAHHVAQGVDDLLDDVDGVNRHAAPDTDDDVRGFVERRSMALLREQPQQIFVQTREHRANSGKRAGRQDLAGVRPLEPGYRRIEFRPEVPGTGLDSVAMSYESVRGVVA